ncbi:MAG: transposase [Erysipelotrichaceae bacterium]|nr:transposase [Erysipelotrichaceae bacterium]
MYDAYSTICSQFFPSATHIIDKFHIITQLSRAVNSLRVLAMNSIKENKDDEPYSIL